MAAIEAECTDTSSLSDKLDIVFVHMVVRRCGMRAVTPHADDIISGFNQAGKDEIALANERCRAAIEGVLAPREERIRASGLTLHQLSDFVRGSAKAYKHDARSKAHLPQMLGALKVLGLSITNGP